MKNRKMESRSLWEGQKDSKTQTMLSSINTALCVGIGLVFREPYRGSIQMGPITKVPRLPGECVEINEYGVVTPEQRVAVVPPILARENPEKVLQHLENQLEPVSHFVTTSPQPISPSRTKFANLKTGDFVATVVQDVWQVGVLWCDDKMQAKLFVVEEHQCIPIVAGETKVVLLEPLRAKALRLGGELDERELTTAYVLRRMIDGERFMQQMRLMALWYTGGLSNAEHLPGMIASRHLVSDAQFRPKPIPLSYLLQLVPLQSRLFYLKKHKCDETAIALAMAENVPVKRRKPSEQDMLIMEAFVQQVSK